MDNTSKVHEGIASGEVGHGGSIEDDSRCRVATQQDVSPSDTRCAAHDLASIDSEALVPSSIAAMTTSAGTFGEGLHEISGGTAAEVEIHAAIPLPLHEPSEAQNLTHGTWSFPFLELITSNDTDNHLTAAFIPPPSRPKPIRSRIAFLLALPEHAYPMPAGHPLNFTLATRHAASSLL